VKEEERVTNALRFCRRSLVRWRSAGHPQTGTLWRAAAWAASALDLATRYIETPHESRVVLTFTGDWDLPENPNDDKGELIWARRSDRRELGRTILDRASRARMAIQEGKRAASLRRPVPHNPGGGSTMPADTGTPER
jgi:hypothetical protein